MTTYPAAEALRKAAAVPSLAHHGLTLNEQTLDAFADGVSIADLSLPDAPIIYVNPAFERISGYDAAELIGRNCRFLQGADRQQPEIAQMAAAIQDRRDIDVVLRNYRKDGTLFWNELRLCLLPDAAGNARYSLAIMRDVTAGRALGDQLYRVTTFDEEGLTGEFRVSDGGNIAFPLIGNVRAGGRTSDQLATAIGDELKRRRLIRDPSVVVEVMNYRPIFVLGEVAKPGEYAYKPGMTLLTAVAVAGGYTYRAVTDYASVVRVAENTAVEGRVARQSLLEPGDTVTVFERRF